MIKLADILKEFYITEEATSIKIGNRSAPNNVIGDKKIAYDILHLGNVVGEVDLYKTEDKAYEVHIIEIDDEYRGKNIAGEAYELIGNELKNKGYSFTSDQLRTMEPSAIRVWEKLVQKGLASKSEDNYTFK
jgi:hypothetical protein